MTRAGSRSQSLASRTAWLFTKDGLPVLASILVGIILGFFVSGVVGLILATLAGFAVLYLFKRPPFRLKPWQALAIDLTPVAGKLFFAMTFLLPIADYLTLPSGHTPDTLPKYLSIVFAVPKNLFSKPSSDIFPGFVFIVIISIVLMYWGSMNLEKRGHWLLALGGLLLYTFSPTITGALVGRPGIHILTAFFGVGYYFAWIGLVLLLLAKVLPRILKVGPEPASNARDMLNLLPPVIAFGLLGHFSTNGGSGHLQLFQLFDFESMHHFFAGVFSAGVAGVSSGVIVSQAKAYDGSDEPDYQDNTDQPSGSEIGPPPEEPPDVPEVDGEIAPPPEEPPDVPEEPPAPQGPVPSTDPEDPPGTTIEHSRDGSVTKRCPDGTWGTKYADGTTYAQGPDGSSVTTYPDGTSKEYSPETGLQVTHPNGDMEITAADGRTGGVKNNQDGSIDITSPYGGTLHCPKDGNPEGSLTTIDGDVIAVNRDGSASFTSSMGKLEIDKDGNMSGNLDDGQGNKLNIGKDGSIDIQTAEGDKITVNADGMKAKFADGSYINTDADGTPTSAHLKDPDGTETDIQTDDKGALHIKDNRGNSADINKDGSGQMKDSDGNVATQDSDGNATLTNKEGTKWVAKNDGSGYVQDKKGNRIDLHNDGSITTTEAGGKSITYTADQLKQMQADSGHQTGGSVDSSAGGS